MYCIYLRKSRKDVELELGGQADTLSRHSAALMALARAQKLPIGQVYREVVSGETITSRPEMQKLLSDVEALRWEGVLVMEVERLARGDTIDQGVVAQTFKYANTKIITPAKTYDPANEFDEEYFEFGLFMSRREYKTINRRLQQGRAASVREGKYAANTAPYGYTRVKLEGQRGFTLAPDPREAPIVQLIFEWYTQGGAQTLGMARIANNLNDLNIPPRNGPDWTSATIREILARETYAGKVAWGKRAQKLVMEGGKKKRSRPRAKAYIIADGLHPALIDAATFQAAQALLKRHAPPVPADKQLKNPLSGLITCGACGRKMVRRPYPEREATLVCTAPRCTNVSTPLHLVEQALLRALQTRLFGLQFLLGSTQSAPDPAHAHFARASLLGEWKQLECQRNSAFTAYERGVYSDAVFLERSRAIEMRMQEVARAITRLGEEVPLPEQPPTAAAAPCAKTLCDIYFALETAQEKNALLKLVLHEAAYTKTQRGSRSIGPGAFDLTLYPLL